jgi:hypothetical protein
VGQKERSVGKTGQAAATRPSPTCRSGTVADVVRGNRQLHYQSMPSPKVELRVGEINGGGTRAHMRIKLLAVWRMI